MVADTMMSEERLTIIELAEVPQGDDPMEYRAIINELCIEIRRLKAQAKEHDCIESYRCYCCGESGCGDGCRCSDLQVWNTPA